MAITDALNPDALRLRVLEMAWAAGSGHLGGSFSCAEILSALYGGALRLDPARPRWPERDRFILSKGHAAPLLYACLAARGFFPESTLGSLRDLGSPLQGHPCAARVPGVDLSTGSLGLGLSAAVGMGLALRAARSEARVYVLLGDGEMQEGGNWEAFMSLLRWRLNRVTPIVDENGVQLDGETRAVLPHQPPLADRLRGFGLRVFPCNGHDRAEIARVLDRAAACEEPHVVLARTVKGRGVSFMEGRSEWHGRPLTPETYAAARVELEGRLNA